MKFLPLFILAMFSACKPSATAPVNSCYYDDFGNMLISKLQGKYASVYIVSDGSLRLLSHNDTARPIYRFDCDLIEKAIAK